MRRMTRESLYTKQKSDERRLDQLERRFDPDPFLGLMPNAYAHSTGFTMDPGTDYSFGILRDQFVGDVEGTADKLVFANTPSGGLDFGCFYSDTVERGIMVDAGLGADGATALFCKVNFTAAAYFSGSAVGSTNLYLDQQSSKWPSFYNNPVINIFATRKIDMEGNVTMLLSGEAVWYGSYTNPEIQSVSDLIFPVIWHDGDDPITAGQSWFTLTRLTPATPDSEVNWDD